MIFLFPSGTICAMEINEAYRKLKDEQERLEPYLPIRYISEVLHLNSTQAQRLIKQLVKQGLAKEFPIGDTGTKRRYRIL